MLQVDDEKQELVPANASNLVDEAMLEREHLQALFIASWDAFANELGYPSLRYISEEVIPHPSCGDRIRCENAAGRRA